MFLSRNFEIEGRECIKTLGCRRQSRVNQPERETTYRLILSLRMSLKVVGLKLSIGANLTFFVLLIML